MPNDIKKLRRLMRTAHYLENKTTEYYDKASSLRGAWWFESFREAMNNGMARFVYRKADGTTRIALGTRSAALIPTDKLPKGDMSDGTAEMEDRIKAIPYFDLDKNEWRSFNVLNFVSLDKVWRFNDTLPFSIDRNQPNPWISVKDRLPERMTSRDSNGTKIINCCSKNVFGYDAWNKIGRLVCYNHESEEWESRDDYRIGKITHWMPTIAPEQEAE